MDPNTMMILMTALSGLSGLGGSEGEHGSTYSSNSRNLIDEAIESVRGMRGGAQDITQNQGYQAGNQWLMDLFNDPEFFKNFEAPLQRQFEENTIPDLANRFASMGSGGSTGSTAFRNQLGREGSNLSTNIAALRGGMQQNGANQALQYAQQPFNNLMQLYGVGTTPTENTYQPPNAGFFGNILPSIFGGVAQGWGQQQGQRFAGQNPSTM